MLIALCPVCAKAKNYCICSKGDTPMTTREKIATRIAKRLCAADDNHWIDCGPKGRQAYLDYADAALADPQIKEGQELLEKDCRYDKGFEAAFDRRVSGINLTVAQLVDLAESGKLVELQDDQRVEMAMNSWGDLGEFHLESEWPDPENMVRRVKPLASGESR